MLANKPYRITAPRETGTVKDKKKYLAPDEDYHKAITAEELLVGIEEDIRELFSKRIKE